MLELELSAPQSTMFKLRDKCIYPLFVGGYSSGKTFSLQVNALWDCLNFGAVRVATYAPTYDLLNLNLIPRVEEMLYGMGIYYKLNKSQYTFDIENGSQLICRSMDNPGRIIAYEVFRSHIDEIDTLPIMKAEEIFLKVIARNRQKVLGEDGEALENTVSFYTTPDHGFSSFTYKKWGKNKVDRDYQFVRASTDSNKHNVKGYADKLRKAYTVEVADAYVAGEWCNITSGIVYHKFDRKINSSNHIAKRGENIILGLDFNVGKMAVVSYVLREKLSMHAIWEIADGKDTPDIILKIKRRFPGSRIFMYPDATGNSRKSVDASKSDIMLLKQAGFQDMSGNVNPRVRDRILASNKAFEDKNVFVNTDQCPVFTESLEQQPYDKNGEPDKSSGLDHSNDAGTYPICIRFPIRRPTTSGRVAGAQ